MNQSTCFDPENAVQTAIAPDAGNAPIDPSAFPLPKDALATQYINRLYEMLSCAPQPEPIPADINRPFLSVLMRTQGTRPAALREALECLAKQSDSDFEVLLVVHKAKPEGKQVVTDAICALPNQLACRVRRFDLETGLRAAPLNFGVTHAYGHYVAMFDDDDLISPDWVKNFHTGADAHPGRVIRAYAESQTWIRKEASNGSEILAPGGEIMRKYCEPFSLRLQMEQNCIPISCAAIPVACFRNFGIRFDETLTTLEDWDCILRCILLCGIHDTGACTFLYRIWKNTETSQSLHSQAEWMENQRRVEAKLNAIPVPTTREELMKLELPRTPMTVGRLREKLASGIQHYGIWRLPFVAVRKLFCKITRRNRRSK